MNLFDKFPSYRYLFANGALAFRRFPFSLLSAVLGVAIAIIMVDKDPAGEVFTHQKLLLTAALGLPLFLALAVFAEKRGWTEKRSWALQACGIVALVVYYFSLPADLSGAVMHFIRFLLLNIGLHFLVAFLPYIERDQTNGFWQFNKSLFLRFLLAALYSAVMFIGLAIALAAADHLFGIEIKETRYFQLWILLAGIFNTWIFLAGIPGNLADLNDMIEYPKALKLFTQYILLPLVVLYFVILIAYEGKIIFNWNWPKGWVSNLVLWYSVVGILSMLLLRPLREGAGNRWIGVFSRWFFRGLVPLVIMLFLAIMKRISDYGITENRYFVLGMAVGLAVTVLYFIFSKNKDIRIIPVVICCSAFLSTYGPQSAFSVSEKDQKGRLVEFLTDNEMISEGILHKTSVSVEYDDRKQMSAIVSYLVEWHGFAPFKDWFDEETLAQFDTLSRYSRAEKICELIGFKYVTRWRSSEIDGYFNLSSDENDFSEIAGYDYLIDIETRNITDFQRILIIDNDSCFISMDEELLALRIRFSYSPHEIEFALSPLIDLIGPDRSSETPLKDLTITEQNSDFQGMLIINRLTGSTKDNTIEMATTLKGYLLIRKSP
ncbi:MAG: DUF4153 domain-containing protein [candidate division Zixibacteria bacterium]